MQNHKDQDTKLYSGMNLRYFPSNPFKLYMHKIYPWGFKEKQD